MECIKIVNTFHEYNDCIEELVKGFVIFRGVSKSNYDLIPKFGRIKHNRLTKSSIENEIHVLNIFKERSTPFLKYRPDNEYEWLALAQHHGVATRLLDWTRNPLVAAYFAVRRDDLIDDSLVYVYRISKILVNIQESQSESPFKISDYIVYQPKHISSRITAQSGLFTIHPDPYKALCNTNISIIKISKTAKTEIKKILYKYGVHAASLFPDLDGIGAYVNWVAQEKTSTSRSQ